MDKIIVTGLGINSTNRIGSNVDYDNVKIGNGLGEWIPDIDLKKDTILLVVFNKSKWVVKKELDRSKEVLTTVDAVYKDIIEFLDKHETEEIQVNRDIPIDKNGYPTRIEPLTNKTIMYYIIRP
jgi:hypothetical protein